MNVNRLKGLITEKGITQLFLAKKLNLSAQSFNAKCNGRSVFNLDEVQNLSCELHLSEKEIWEIFFKNDIS